MYALSQGPLMPQYALFIMPLVSIALGIITAFVAHYLASKRSREKELLSFQILAYSDFISAVSDISVMRRQGNTENTPEVLTRLNNAKSRIIVCGEDDVVKHLIEFWESNATLELELGLVTFSRLLTSMRKSLGDKKLGYHQGISNTLFKLEPSQYSFKTEQSEKKVII